MKLRAKYLQKLDAIRKGRSIRVESFTERFLEDVRKSEAAHQKGDYVSCSSREEKDRLFDSM